MLPSAAPASKHTQTVSQNKYLSYLLRVLENNIIYQYCINISKSEV